MHTYTLGYHDGFLCVVYSSPLWSEPVLVSHWGPVVRIPIETVEARGFKIGDPVLEIEPGLYHQFTSQGGFSPKLLLINGPQTEPIKTTETPIPPPKTKHEVKYERECWHKHLKRGWVSC